MAKSIGLRNRELHLPSLEERRVWCTARYVLRCRREESDDDLLSRAGGLSIIGAALFHGPVRDGKGWCQGAMVVRLEACVGLVCFGVGWWWCVGIWRYSHRIKPVGRLVRLSSTGYPAYTCRLLTWWSSTALMGKSDLEASFALRCFQRLSLPHLATRRCDWRHNRYTRGASAPVLSY